MLVWEVHFLIPKTKILSSALRAAGEKRQGDIKAILLSGGMYQHLHGTLDSNSSSEVTSKTMTVSYGEALALNLMPTR